MKKYSLKKLSALAFYFLIFCHAYTDMPQKQDTIDQENVTIPDFIETKREEKSRSDFSKDDLQNLNLYNESLENVLVLLEKLTGKIILQQNNLPKFQVNFNSNGKIAKIDAIRAIESILSMNGISIVEENKFLKAVNSASAKNSAPRFLDVNEISSIPSDEKVYSYAFILNYLSVQEIGNMIPSMLTPKVSSMIALEKANGFILTDVLSNIKRVEALLKRIDVPVNMKEDVFFFKLKNVTAQEMEKRLNSLESKSLKKYLKGNTSFDSDARTNQLIVVTPKGNIDIVRTFIDNLDINVSSLTRSEVFNLRYADAVEVRDLLKRVISGQKAAKSEADKLSRLSGPGKDNSSSMHFSDKIVVEADKRSNCVVVFGINQDIDNAKAFINGVDQVLPQVRIEVIIAEVTLKKGQVSGIESFQYTHPGDTSKAGNSKHSMVATLPTNSILGASTGPISLGFNKFKWDCILRSAESNDKIKFLATPTILTSHNQEANIKATESRPFLTKIVSKDAGDSSNANSTVVGNEVEQKEAGIELKVKPLVGSNGVIQMKINQKFDTFLPGITIGNVDQPYVAKREVDSFVTVKSGEIIFLGGLRQISDAKRKKSLTFFGSLPLIGSIFNPNSDGIETKEIVMFIRPHVMKDTDEAYSSAKEDLAKSDSREIIEEYLEKNKINNEELKKYWQDKEDSDKNRPVRFRNPKYKKTDTLKTDKIAQKTNQVKEFAKKANNPDVRNLKTRPTSPAKSVNNATSIQKISPVENKKPVVSTKKDIGKITFKGPRKTVRK